LDKDFDKNERMSGFCRQIRVP